MMAQRTHDQRSARADAIHQTPHGHRGQSRQYCKKADQNTHHQWRRLQVNGIQRNDDPARRHGRVVQGDMRDQIMNGFHVHSGISVPDNRRPITAKPAGNRWQRHWPGNRYMTEIIPPDYSAPADLNCGCAASRYRLVMPEPAGRCAPFKRIRYPVSLAKRNRLYNLCILSSHAVSIAEIQWTIRKLRCVKPMRKFAT